MRWFRRSLINPAFFSCTVYSIYFLEVNKYLDHFKVVYTVDTAIHISQKTTTRYTYTIVTLQNSCVMCIRLYVYTYIYGLKGAFLKQHLQYYNLYRRCYYCNIKSRKKHNYKLIFSKMLWVVSVGRDIVCSVYTVVVDMLTAKPRGQVEGVGQGSTVVTASRSQRSSPFTVS